MAAPLRVLVNSAKAGDAEGWFFSNLPLDGNRSSLFLQFLRISSSLQAFRDYQELLTNEVAGTFEGPPFHLRQSAYPDFSTFKTVVRERLAKGDWNSKDTGMLPDEGFLIAYYDIFCFRDGSLSLAQRDWISPAATLSIDLKQFAASTVRAIAKTFQPENIGRFSLHQVRFRSVADILAALIVEKSLLEKANHDRKLLEEAPKSQRYPVFNALKYGRAEWELTVEKTMEHVLTSSRFQNRFEKQGTQIRDEKQNKKDNDAAQVESKPPVEQ